MVACQHTSSELFPTTPLCSVAMKLLSDLFHTTEMGLLVRTAYRTGLTTFHLALQDKDVVGVMMFWH